MDRRARGEEGRRLICHLSSISSGGFCWQGVDTSYGSHGDMCGVPILIVLYMCSTALLFLEWGGGGRGGEEKGKGGGKGGGGGFRESRFSAHFSPAENNKNSVVSFFILILI